MIYNADEIAAKLVASLNIDSLMRKINAALCIAQYSYNVRLMDRLGLFDRSYEDYQFVIRRELEQDGFKNIRFKVDDFGLEVEFTI